jgi:hypothetical protein
LFLWTHDWIPLGPLNNVAAGRSQDTTRRLALVTPIQSLQFTVGLLFSLLNFARPYPNWLYNWLWISFGVLFVGQIRAWWIPYLFEWSRSGPIVIGIIFGNTHSFLPLHNGVVPNTAHVLLHLSTAATLAILLLARMRLLR